MSGQIPVDEPEQEIDDSGRKGRFKIRVENDMANVNNRSRIRAWWWRRAGWWWCTRM